MGKVFKFGEKEKKSKNLDSKSQQIVVSDKKNNSFSLTKILGLVGFIASICIAVSLIFRLAFNEHSPVVAKVFQVIGEGLAYIVCIGLGFLWTRGKEKVWWLVCWIVATVVISIVYIFTVIYTF